MLFTFLSHNIRQKEKYQCHLDVIARDKQRVRHAAGDAARKPGLTTCLTFERLVSSVNDSLRFISIFVRRIHTVFIH